MKLPKKGDYIISSPTDKKFQLLKVRSATPDKITAVVETAKVENKRISVEVKPEDVRVNLGSEPPFGRVYGQLVEPLRSTLEYKKWGEIHYYRPMEKDEKKLLKQCLDKVYAEFESRKLLFVFPITIEIRHKQGRFAGHYKTSPKIENEHNHLTCFHPMAFDKQNTVELIRHEMGHAVWFKGVPPRMQLKWINLYTHYLKLHTAKLEVIQSMRKGLEHMRDLKAFKDSIEPHDDNDNAGKKFSKADFLDECINFIKSTFNLDNDEVDLLIERSESLEPYWPKHPFDLSHEHNHEVVMTDYGMKNPREFFAESFQMYLAGKAGKKIKKLMDKTLSRLAR